MHPALLRPAAVLVAGLLAAGALQTLPAAAAPGDGPVASIALTVATTSSTAPGVGSSPDRPAPLGAAPGSTELAVRITNTGTVALHALSVTDRVVANGVLTSPTCDTQPEPAAQPAVDVVLDPGSSLRCRASLSGVLEDVLHDDVTSVVATGVGSGAPVSAETHFYATAVDESVRLGDLVWLDSDRDGVQDAGEPGIPGVRLRVTGPDGAAAPDLVVPGQVVGPQTTDDQGRYTFRHLSPLPSGARYTVTVDPTSPALEHLAPTVAGVGTPDLDSSTGSASSAAGLSLKSRDATLDFGFVSPTPAPTKAQVALTADASPGTALIGTPVTIRGTIRRDGKAFPTGTALEFQADGRSSWSKVENVRSNSQGTLSATSTASGSGSFRYRFAGDGTTEAGASSGVHVVVRKAAVRLTVVATPAGAVVGRTITVRGSIQREGKAYQAATLLEFRADGGSAWTRVKSVGSTSKGALSTGVRASRSGSFRYRFAGNGTTTAGVSAADHVVVAKAPVRLSVDAPGSVTKGKKIAVKGSIRRDGKAYATSTVLEFRSDGGNSWRRVKAVRSTSKGALSSTEKPSRSGSFRYRFAGNSTTSAGTSRGDHVTVKPKPVSLPAPKEYANCTALHEVYPHGVGRSGAKDHTSSGSDPVTNFTVDTATYNLNTKSDRDDDGIACEKH